MAMRKTIRTMLFVGLLMGMAGLVSSPQVAARGRQQKEAVIMMKVGETRQLDGRHFKSPQIQHPGIVKLIRHGQANKYTMKARKRGVTFLTFKAPLSPNPQGNKTQRVKIIVR
jgi:hypothetical protein